MSHANMSQTILIMAGGTGGHVFPALAAARELEARGVKVVWLGTHKGLEARVVPEAGIQMEWVDVGGLRGKGWRTLIVAPAKIVRAVLQCRSVFARIQPDAVLGMGGYTAGPGGLTAWLVRTPLVIHEQNAIAGYTNRWLAKFATRVLSGFPEVLPDAEWVGNPVRAEIAAIAEPAQRYAERAGEPLRLLVLGGSLGALALNEIVPKALAKLPDDMAITVRHQTGKSTFDVATRCYKEAMIAEHVETKVTEFIDDMAEAYAWADVVIARSGALTCAEIAAAGLPSILVPFPHAVDDHQTANAEHLVEAGAARIVQQRELSPEHLSELLISQYSDRAVLLTMAEAARTLAKPEATESIVVACLAPKSKAVAAVTQEHTSGEEK